MASTVYREYTCSCGATATEVALRIAIPGDEPEPRECHNCGRPMAVAVRIGAVVVR